MTHLLLLLFLLAPTSLVWAKKEKKETTATKSAKHMTYDELKAKKAEYEAQHHKEAIKKVVELMLPLCSDLNEHRTLMLELADLLYDDGDFDKAGTLYQEFTKLYPGSTKVEYASYQAIMCAFKQMREADRDQSKTREALELAQTFLNRSVFITYAKEVKEMLIKCQERLFESELGIALFYANRGSYTAATKRFDYIRDNLLGDLPSNEPLIIAWEYDCATKHHKTELAEQKKTELMTKFPTQAPLLLAHDQPQRALSNRF